MPGVTSPSAMVSSAHGSASKYKKYTTVSGMSHISGGSSTISASGTSGRNPVAGNGSGISKRTSVRGLFDGLVAGGGSGGASAIIGSGYKDSDSATHGPPEGTGSGFSAASSKLTTGRTDGPWSVSVAQVASIELCKPNTGTFTNGASKPKKKSKTSPWNAFSNSSSSNNGKEASSSHGTKGEQEDGGDVYTLYISTPTHNLTLTRTAAQIVTLDKKLREGQSYSSALPVLPPLHVGSATTGAGKGMTDSGAPSQQTSSRKLLQTISRTLSPGGGRTRTALSNLTTAGNEQPSNPLSGDSAKASSAACAFTTANGIKAPTPVAAAREKDISNLLLSPDVVASPPLTPSADGTVKLNASHAATTHIATYLTTIANLPFIKRHSAWKRFTRVEADDLQSVRVERRIKKVRSDLAKHVKSSVAPKNTNINTLDHDPTQSQSDFGEDDARPDEDHDSVLSGRSRDGGATSAVSSVEAFHASNTPGTTSLCAATLGARRRSAAGASNTASSVNSVPTTFGAAGTLPDVPARSTSVDPAKGGASKQQLERNVTISNANAAAASRSFVSIPEDNEVAKPYPSDRKCATAPTDNASSSVGDTTATSHGRETSAGAASSAAGATSNTTLTSSSDGNARKQGGSHDGRRRGRDMVTVHDFEMIRVLGKGCAGKVLLVRHTQSNGLFAMKSIHKRHVLAHQELQHTLTEQSVLKRMAKDANEPFIVRLWWSFHDRANLYLVMDFHPGGDLATQLSRWGRLGRDRARFYAAEIVEGVEGLHKAGVIYRDLKPENVLIGSDGHIVLSDFGLSKEFPQMPDEAGSNDRSTPPTSPLRSQSSNNIKAKQPHWMGSGVDDSSTGRSTTSLKRWSEQRDTTTTFCGTAEYLAPEVIQGSAYSYEVDWWSFGTMLYEMLTGITPFWADTHADMYVRVLHDELVFPEDRVLDTDTKSILRGLLQRNPLLRMKEPRIKKHPYFSMIEWAHVFHKRYIPPYVPPINPLDETDTQNFDEAFLDMQPTVTNAVEEDAAEEEAAAQAEVEKAKRLAEEKRLAEVSATGQPVDAEVRSLFDGYSFRGRRDSESIKSTIMSISSDSQPSASVEPDGATEATTTAVTPGCASAQAKATEVAATEEHDEEAARAAVATLAYLEREASGEVTPASNPSVQSGSTRLTSAVLSCEGALSVNSVGDDSGLVVGLTKVRASHAGAPSQGAIFETDDDDDDWDMVDGTAEPLRSEVNGGKGQNLFSRGVVDTYRLLRRQEPLRQPTSPGAKALNRRSRRQPSSGEPRKQRSEGKTSSQLRSPSRASTSSDNDATQLSGEVMTNSQSKVSGEDQTSEDPSADMSIARSEGTRMTPSASIASNKAKTSNTRKGANASVASSYDLHRHEKSKQPKAKRMKRFTTFFVEAASKFD